MGFGVFYFSNKVGKERNVIMKKRMLSVIIAIFLSICFAAPCFAGWLIFHKPEYRGRIIDAETKEPIEGVVIAVLYYVFPHISGPAGGNPRFIHAKEALTDKNGEFVIPSYTTLMSPNSFEWLSDFVIYKAGYESYPTNSRIYPFKYCGSGSYFPRAECGPEYLFSHEMDTKGEMDTGSEIVTITFGVVELSKLETREERIRATSAMSNEEDKTPLLLNAVNEELKRFGLGIVGPFGR